MDRPVLLNGFERESGEQSEGLVPVGVARPAEGPVNGVVEGVTVQQKTRAATEKTEKREAVE
jgi:hypothetical protein